MNAQTTPRILRIKAERIITSIDSDHENGVRQHVAIFKPTKATIEAIRAASDGNYAVLQVELDDETGAWVNHSDWYLEEFRLSSDGRAASIRLGRA